MSNSDDITFYPEIRYKGMRVTPYAWKDDATEPILRVRLDALDFPPHTDYAEIAERLRAEGWTVWDPREEAFKDVHVDDLEKIEGPPPKGAF